MMNIQQANCQHSTMASAIARVLAGVALSALAVGRTLAQDPSWPAQAPTLDRITVTAQKREEPLKEVPMAISVVDASKMADRGAVQLTDYFSQVPGLSINARGAGRTQLILRGISTGSGGNPTVGITIDDAPYGSSSSRGGGDFMVPDLDPAELQHIEVLKGPQGTLYGASSMGGLLKYVTVAPDPTQTSGRVQFDASSNGGDHGFGVRSSVNLPLVQDKFALRVSVFQREDPGYIDDTLQGREDVNDAMVRGGRVAAFWQAADNVTVRASALLQNSRSGATPNEDVRFDYSTLNGDYTHERLRGTDGFEGTSRFYDATVNVDLGWASFDSISAYGQHRHDGPQDVTGTFGGIAQAIFGRPGMGVVIDNLLSTDKFSQEFRLASTVSDSPFNWMLGAFYTREKSEGRQRLRVVDPTTGGEVGLPYMYNARTPSIFSEKALFANVSYQFTDRFDLQVGGRYSSNDERYNEYIDGPMNGGFSENTGSSGENVFTYSLTPRFKLSEQLMVYGRVATGYRAGGQNQTLGISLEEIPDAYDSDSLVNYEIGLKGEFFDRSLTLDTSLFYIDWSDIQLRQVDQSTGESYYANGGKAKSQGIEASLAWRPVAGLTVTGSAALTDAVLQEDTRAGTFGLRGDRLPYSAKRTGSLSVVKDFMVGDNLLAFVGGNISYMGDRLAPFNNVATTPRFVMPSFTTGDINGGLQGDNWTLSLFVKNITDEKGYLSATPRNSTTGLSAYGVGLIQPRTYGVSFAFDY